VTSIDLSSDGRYLVSGSADDYIVVYDIFNKKIHKKISAHEDDVLSIALSGDGNWIVSTGADRRINIWDTQSARLIHSNSDVKSWTRDVSFIESDTQLISCSDDSRVHYWDFTVDGKLYPRNNVRYGFDRLLSVDYSDNDDVTAAGGLDGSLRIKFKFGKYAYRSRNPISKIIYGTNSQGTIRVFLATLGKGVMLIEGSDLVLD